MVQSDRHLADRRETLDLDQVILSRDESPLQSSRSSNPLQDSGKEFGKRVVLGEVVIGPLSQGGGREYFAPMGRNHDDTRWVWPIEETREKINSLGIRELLIEKDDFDGIRCGDGIFARPDVTCRLVALEFEEVHHQPRH